MSEPILFEDHFVVESVNSQKYVRVSRITAHSDDQSIILTLDVNTELYPMTAPDRVQIALASTLNLDGSKDEGKGWRDVGMGELTLANEYDYVCRGKIYRFNEGQDDNIQVFVSFGGLLLYIEGPYQKLSPLRLEHIYLLMKR